MRIKTYIKEYPKSYLAKELSTENPETKIIVGSGTISTHKCSNLGKAILKAGKKYKDYKVGGKAGTFANDGSHWAVLLK